MKTVLTSKNESIYAFTLMTSFNSLYISTHIPEFTFYIKKKKVHFSMMLLEVALKDHHYLLGGKKKWQVGNFKYF